MSSMSDEHVLKPWTLMIVDDEVGLHEVTRLVIKRLIFGGRQMRIVSAFSAEEARAMLETDRDIAVALIDVVMEDDQAGLGLVRDMREKFGMAHTRIILRTGNPGMAPEREVMQHFQIDDYRDKTELTSDRLFTLVYSSLRSYQTVTTLEQTAKGLKHIIESAGNLSRRENFVDFLSGLAMQISGIAGAHDGLLLVADAIGFSKGAEGAKVVFSAGAYTSWLAQGLKTVAPSALVKRIEGASTKDTLEVFDDGLMVSFWSPAREHFVLWLPMPAKPAVEVLRILREFLEKFRLAFENARLQEEIIDAQRVALHRVCEAVERRTPNFDQHVLRVAKYSRLLAELAGLPPNQVQQLETAAPLHDIGKVTIPDDIFKRHGFLDAAETKIWQNHAQAGWAILIASYSEILQLGASIALTHHERWDGSGYPRGLKGEEIPLHGRIVGLVDVFDALMSKRAHKEPFSFERTAQVVQGGAGKLFDPHLAKLLLAHGDAFKAIFDAYPD